MKVYVKNVVWTSDELNNQATNSMKFVEENQKLSPHSLYTSYLICPDKNTLEYAMECQCKDGLLVLSRWALSKIRNEVEAEMESANVLFQL